MKHLKIVLSLTVVVAVLFIGCQKDDHLTKSSQSATQSVQEVNDWQNYELPHFNLEQFKENHKPIDIYEKYNVAQEDLADLKLPNFEAEMASRKSMVVIPAGSVDALGPALAAVGHNGLVVFKSGVHTESGRVVISDKVTIIGMPGAVLETSTPGGSPTIHVKDAQHVRVFGLEMHAITRAGSGSQAILIQNGDHTLLMSNMILGYDLGIVNEHGDHSSFALNTIAGSGMNDNIINMNGDYVKILGNDLSNGRFGAWLCDDKGQYKYNTTYGNFIGVILCKVPMNRSLPDGSITGSENSGNQWKVQRNDSYTNVYGYLVIDGANNNMLSKNTASSNGAYDVELAGDSYRFGFFTPTSFENTVFAEDNMTVKDCGLDNTVRGGIMIDTGTDPCD